MLAYKRMKKRLFAFLRFLLAVGLVLFLVNHIGLEQLALVLSSLNPAYFALLYGILLLDAVLRAYNWSLLLRTRDHFLPIWEMLYNYLVGAFWGTFIPSSFGVDISRTFLIARRNEIKMRDSALALLVLNMIGLLALCIIAFFSAFLLLNVLDDPAIVWLIVPICLAYVMLFPFLMRGWMPDGKRFQLFKLEPLLARIRQFSTALRTFKNHRATMIGVLIIAFLNQILGILIFYTVSLALDINVPFILFLTYVPIITLSRLIPFSIAGLGAEQGIFVFLFAQSGVPAAEAFLISFILSVTNISFTLLGGGIYTLNSLHHLLWQRSSSPL